MSPEVKALMAKATAALGRVEEIRKRIVDEKRELTAEETENLKTAVAEGRSFKAQAEQLHDEAQLKADIDKIPSMPLFVDKKAASDTISVNPQAGMYSEQKAFRSWLSNPNVPVEYRSGLVSEEGKAWGETADATGGVTVPEQMATFVITKRDAANLLRQRCTVISTQAQSFTIPTFTDTTTPSAVPEHGATAESTMNGWGKVRLTPAKYRLMAKISTDLLDDSGVNVEQFMGNHVGTRFGVSEEDQIMNGVGGLNPIGLLTAVFTNTADIAGATDAIAAEDITEAFYTLKQAYRRDAVWIMPNLTIQEIVNFRGMEGGDGTGPFLWLPSFSLGVPDTILGRALLESEAFADPTANGDAMFMFGSLETYYIADRKTFGVTRDPYSAISTDEVSFWFSRRFDGTPTDDNAFVRYNRN